MRLVEWGNEEQQETNIITMLLLSAKSNQFAGDEWGVEGIGRRTCDLQPQVPLTICWWQIPGILKAGG